MIPKTLITLLIIFYPIFIKRMENKKKDEYNSLRDKKY
ncbi:hypothetical protein ACUXJ9_001199 [Staphylococcus caledonicus]